MTSPTHSIKKQEKPIIFQPGSLAEHFLAATKLKEIGRLTKAIIKKWPQAWKTITFKEYSRLPQVPLPTKNFTLKGVSLKTALLKRKSTRQFGKSLSLTQLSELLYFSSGIVRNEGQGLDTTRRTYPSGGARYPLEIYLMINRVAKLEPGLYHYNVRKHCLERLAKGNFGAEIANCVAFDWVKDASVVFFIAAVFQRTAIKYKDRGLRYIFLEGGHLCQNFYLLTTAFNLSCCSIGGYADQKIDQLLDLNGLDESVIYLVCVG